MIMQGRLHPIARGAKNDKVGKTKRAVTFINSFYGKKDSEGLYLETGTVSCWLEHEVAKTLTLGKVIDGVIDVNGDFVSVKELTIDGRRYVVDEKGVAKLAPEGYDPSEVLGYGDDNSGDDDNAGLITRV